MKKSTVERMYSAKVAQLLNDGWHINTGTICQKFQLMILATVVSSFSVGPLCHMLCRYSTKVMSTLILAISRLSP